jgi:hypothetical protein
LDWIQNSIKIQQNSILQVSRMEYQQWHGCQNVSPGATDSNLNTQEKRGGEGTQAGLTFFNRIQGNKDCAVHSPNYNRINNHICVSNELKLQLPSQPFTETHCLNSKIYSTTVDSATFVMRDDNVGRWTRSQCTKIHLPKHRRPEEWHKNPHLKTCRHTYKDHLVKPSSLTKPFHIPSTITYSQSYSYPKILGDEKRDLGAYQFLQASHWTIRLSGL